MATVRTPVKVILDENTQVSGLGEYAVGEVVGVIDGGTGVDSFAAGKILIGNGTSKIMEKTRTSITSNNSAIQIVGGVESSIGDSDVVVSFDETQLNLSNMQGLISPSQISSQVTPGFSTPIFHVDGGSY